jgi:acetolactate synthase regulatory subunit
MVHRGFMMISFVTATRKNAYKSEWVRVTIDSDGKHHNLQNRERQVSPVDKVRVIEIKSRRSVVKFILLSVVMAYCQVDVTHYVMDIHLV